MAWTLSIDTIDVGQGDSSLVVAEDLAIPQRKTVLIDGGEPGKGQTVNTFLLNRLGNLPVDFIVVSHYEDDHYGGIVELLVSDNFSFVCGMIGNAAAFYIGTANTREKRVAAGAAYACAVMFGAYDNPDPGGGNYDNIGRTIANQAMNGVPVNSTDAQAAKFGYDLAVKKCPYYILNASLVMTAQKRREASTQSAVAAIMAAGGMAQLAAFNEVFSCLHSRVNGNPQFTTGGRFNTTYVFDNGAQNCPGAYREAVEGYFYLSDKKIKAPGINRTRYAPVLGVEMLWHFGPAPGNSPVNAPEMFLFARLAYVWNAPLNALPITTNPNANNYMSYGMVIRFGNFFFYTGGDLPYVGEDLIADSVMNYQLPNNNGAPYPLPQRVAAFKCGHHGSSTSTSNYFINTVLPRGAFISCGGNDKYNHPSQSVITDLHNSLDVTYFYLTACKPARVFIPASNNGNQLVGGNKSRVAGGIAVPPGNIRLVITQAESQAAANNVGRRYQVQYFDYDQLPIGGANRAEITVF